MGEVLSSVTTPPAHIEDVGERDPVEVVKLATRTMQQTSGGWYADGVAKTVKSLKEAASSISAMIVADDPPVPGPAVSHGGPKASAGEAEAEFLDQYAQADAREANSNITTANDSIPARVWRRTGAEVDAKSIRVGSG